MKIKEHNKINPTIQKETQNLKTNKYKKSKTNAKNQIQKHPKIYLIKNKQLQKTILKLSFFKERTLK
jgi:hypothetical protein